MHTLFHLVSSSIVVNYSSDYNGVSLATSLLLVTSPPVSPWSVRSLKLVSAVIIANAVLITLHAPNSWNCHSKDVIAKASHIWANVLCLCQSV